MKKKNIIFIIVGILVILSIYKMMIINSYTINKMEKKKIDEIINGLIIKDLKVILKEEQEEEEYLTFQNIKVRNIFKEFTCIEQDNTYSCQKEDGSTFLMKKTTSFTDKWEKYQEKNHIKEGTYKTDIDLLGAIKDASTSKNTLLKPGGYIKRDYFLQKYAIDNIPNIHSIDLVEGDYSGYILHTTSNSRELYITYKKNTYTFQFTNLDYFTEEVIQNFMNSIIISK